MTDVTAALVIRPFTAGDGVATAACDARVPGDARARDCERAGFCRVARFENSDRAYWILVCDVGQRRGRTWST